MYSFQISVILLDLVSPFISSISISVTSSMICELVKFDPTILILQILNNNPLHLAQVACFPEDS